MTPGLCVPNGFVWRTSQGPGERTDPRVGSRRRDAPSMGTRVKVIVAGLIGETDYAREGRVLLHGIGHAIVPDMPVSLTYILKNYVGGPIVFVELSGRVERSKVKMNHTLCSLVAKGGAVEFVAGAVTPHD